MNIDFNEEYEIDVSTETFGVVGSIEEWVAPVNVFKRHVDFEGIKYLQRTGNVKGFMLNPVVLLEGKTFAAITRKVYDISLFKDYIKDKSILIYCVWFNPIPPIYVDDKTHEVLDKLCFGVGKTYWDIRYTEIN